MRTFDGTLGKRGWARVFVGVLKGVSVGVILGILSLVGCGYSLGYRAPPKVHTIAIPVFHNATFPLRREVEYDLTSLVRQEFQKRSELEVVASEGADLVLWGTLLEFREGIVSEGDRNRKIESNIYALVEITIEDNVNGYKMSRRISDTEPFSEEAGGSFSSAQARALEALAERIVADVEYWDEYEENSGPGTAGADT